MAGVQTRTNVVAHQAAIDQWCNRLHCTYPFPETSCLVGENFEPLRNMHAVRSKGYFMPLTDCICMRSDPQSNRLNACVATGKLRQVAIRTQRLCSCYRPTQYTKQFQCSVEKKQPKELFYTAFLS